MKWLNSGIFLILLFNASNSQSIENIGRFVSLKGKETNVRNGPSEEYKILYKYDKTFMPLEVLHQIDNWYMVRDYQNKVGWLKMNLVLSNKKNRKIIIISKAKLCRFIKPEKCTTIAIIDKSITAKVTACNKNWCRIIISDYNISGWIERKSIWGVFDDEIF